MTAPRALALRFWLGSALVLVAAGTARAQVDPLPSWSSGPTKQAIVNFVVDAAREGASGFIPPAERIAVFDNDGTLWAEQPLYFQLHFALDRIHALAPSHPEWAATEPYASVLKGDVKGVLAGGEQAILELMMATHAAMTTDEFHQTVDEWLLSARHPRFGRPYTEIVYLPMIELLSLLRANGFKTFIVSGGGIEFIRVWTERVYGIPPEQVVGSTIKTKLETKGGKPVLMRLPEIDFVDDKEGKPIAINRVIGRRPVVAFGNSDGDHPMLQWTAAGSGLRLMGIVHHTDSDREWAYDRESHIGRLDKALDEAQARGWTVVDMKRDWKKVFAFEENEPQSEPVECPSRW